MSANVEPRGSPDQAIFPIATMARVLGVSKAGYYAWLHRLPFAHAVADAALLKRVRTVHASLAPDLWGTPRPCRSAGGRREAWTQADRALDAQRRAGRRLPSAWRTHHDPAGQRGPARARLGGPQLHSIKAEPAMDRRHHLTCRLRRGSCIWLSCWMSGAARSSAGRWRTICKPSWCWTRWRWRWAASAAQRDPS